MTEDNEDHYRTLDIRLALPGHARAIGTHDRESSAGFPRDVTAGG